jgi:FkbH-like protein
VIAGAAMRTLSSAPGAYEAARGLRSHRLELAAATFQAARDSRCGDLQLPATFGEFHEYGREHFLTVVDLAAHALEHGGSLYQDLFVGWIKAQLHQAAGASERIDSSYAPVVLLNALRAVWPARLGGRLSPGALRQLDEFLRAAIAALSIEYRRSLTLLFVGDCFAAELAASLVGPCALEGVGLTCRQLNDKVQPLLRNRIKALQGSFDLVFFSPFTHGFIQEYAAVLHWRTAGWGRGRFYSTLEQLTDDALATARTLAERFGCPVYVHNAAGTVQSNGTTGALLKQLASARNARQAQAYIREKLERSLATSADGRIRLVDETALCRRLGRRSLGKTVFPGRIFHPTRIGFELSRGIYLDATVSNAFLSTKKLVVCDLDNTLWDGIIGEGTVRPFADRQRVLKRLRRKGVLLSINSKNDPGNVVFHGGELDLVDFVAPRINWKPKCDNMASILQELNLRAKDVAFIDDRPDELERMQAAFREMTVLDSTLESTWRRLAHWEANLQSFSEEDRTKLYHEKAARETFLATSGSIEDEAAALGRLELCVTIDSARGSALKRVTELINRTNQFNLCGSRTTLAELQSGLGSSHHVLTASARDKFGSMGVVGAMRVDVRADSVEIPIFVLSCRVFGFGIEYALLNSVKALGAHRTLIGHYTETSHNSPARELYPKSRLDWNGAAWMGDTRDLPDDPAWLTVERRCLEPSHGDPVAARA